MNTLALHSPSLSVFLSLDPLEGEHFSPWVSTVHFTEHSSCLREWQSTTGTGETKETTVDLTVDHDYWRERMSERNSAQSKAAVP